MKVSDIRRKIAAKYQNNEFVIDKTGVKTIELVGTSFLADEKNIFGKINEDYIKRELEWYESQSLFVDDIPGETPAIWTVVSSKYGEINSNYGFLIYNKENFSQYENTLNTLKNDPNSRRAIMIYTRPSMQLVYNRDGMSDFICTNTVQYLIRDNKLDCIVNMRSNDGWAGYRNDKAWQDYVHKKLANDLEIEIGDMFWQTGSLHLYQHQFYFVHHYLETGELHISKKDFNQKYINFEYMI